MAAATVASPKAVAQSAIPTLVRDALERSLHPQIGRRSGDKRAAPVQENAPKTRHRSVGQDFVSAHLEPR